MSDQLTGAALEEKLRRILGPKYIRTTWRAHPLTRTAEQRRITQMLGCRRRRARDPDRYRAQARAWWKANAGRINAARRAKFAKKGIK